MSLSLDEVRHVANLARLALRDDELEQLRDQLASILAYARKVGEVATEEIPPTSHAYPLANVWREDEPRPCLPVDEALAPGPRVQDGRFRVPRIISEEA